MRKTHSLIYMSLCTGGYDVPYEEICIFKMSFIQAGVIVLLAVSSTLVNQ